MGHVIEHIALETQTLAGILGLEELVRLKLRGLTMLFSVIPKKTLVFAAEICCFYAEALIAGTEYDLESDFTKCEKLENVFA
jgi:cyanophycin synthetase